MSYSVDLEGDCLQCKTEEAAHHAAVLINADTWMHHHLKVVPVERSVPQEGRVWFLEINEFDGCGWNIDASDAVWLAIAPHMADGANLEFRGEAADRWRIRWQAARVFTDNVKEVIWTVNEEITAPAQKEDAP